MFSPVFLSPGLDPDAWRMLLSAEHIAATHTYVASRLPGYPIPELVFSLPGGRPIWFCVGLTFFITVGGCVAYYNLLKTVGIKDRLLVTLAFVCTPVVFINSFTTMDYLWAISFALASFYAASIRRPIVSGLLLGLAVGCRITTALMAVPLVLLLSFVHSDKKLRLRQTTLFLAFAGITSLVSFGPVIRAYGAAFLQHSGALSTSIISSAKLITVDTFGIPGVLGFLAALIFQIVRKDSSRDYSLQVQEHWKTVSLVVVVLYGILFAALPLEAGYLIPLLPFLLLLLRFYFSRTSFRILAFSLLLSPFLLSVDAVDRPWSPMPSALSIPIVVKQRKLAIDFLNGPLLHDLHKRASEVKFAESVLEWALAQPDTALLVAGVWMPPLMYLSGQLPSERGEQQFFSGKVKVIGLVDTAIASEILRNKAGLFYLPGQGRYNKSVYGIDLQEFEGKQLTLVGHAKSPL